MTTQLAIIFVLTVVIHAIDTGALASRLAGVRTGRLTLAQSLYNVMSIGSRGANAFAAPLIASLTDLAADQSDTAALAQTYRIVLLAATAGTLVAGILIPSLSRLLASGVSSYERRQSLPRVVVQATSVRGLEIMSRRLRRPSLTAVIQARRSPFPRRFLLASILTTAVFTVGNFAALYASALVPDGIRTATSLAPIVTGGAALLNIMFVGPIAALVIDQALRGERPAHDVTYITIWQIGARLVGTILAQALLVPTGLALSYATRWLIIWTS